MRSRSFLLALVATVAGCGEAMRDDEGPSTPALDQPAETVDLPDVVKKLAADETFLYAASDTRIFRIHKQTLAAEPLVDLTTNGATDVVALAVDASAIYWSNASVAARAIWRASKSGGVPEVLAASGGEWFAGPIALDADRIYFGEATLASRGRIRSVAKTGGRIVEIATDTDGVTGLTTDGEHVFWCAGAKVRRAEKLGGRTETLHTGQRRCGADLQRHGERLRWLDEPTIAHSGDAYVAGERTLFDLSTNGGTLSELARGNLSSLDASGMKPVLVRNAPDNDNVRKRHVSVVGSNGLTDRLGVTYSKKSNIAGWSPLVSDAERIYWVDNWSDAGTSTVRSTLRVIRR
jgi:frataxin-like iron-binding protein CyaY